MAAREATTRGGPRGYDPRRLAREATTHGYAPRGTREASSRRGDAGGVDGGAGAGNNAQRERERAGDSSYIGAVYYVIS